jgi:hypothetical protein
MRKIRSILTFICFSSFVVFFQSCNGNEEVKNPNESIKELQLTDAEQKVLFQIRNKKDKIGIGEATQIANEVINFLDEGIKTKSSKTRTIGTITVLHNVNEIKVATKSSNNNTEVEMPDTLAYLFNFADSTGYTIIAADTRIDNPVLCYTDNGTLTNNFDNLGLAIFLTGTEDYIKRTIVEAQQMRDSLISSILNKIAETGVKDTVYVNKDETTTKVIAPTETTYNDEVSTSYSYGPWSVNSRIGPLLSVEWGQRAPFNAYVSKSCSDDPSGKAPVGCVAVSTSYILTYWFNRRSVDFTIDGYNVNSNLLCRYTWWPNRYTGAATNDIETSTTAEANTARYQVAHLMERIGSRISMSYGCDGSSADDKNATSYLREIGFKGGYRADYNLNTVISSLNNSRPLMIGGYSTKNHFLGISWLYYLSGGHSWVIDGYLRRSRQVTATVTTTTTEETNLMQLTKAIPKLMLITTTSTYTYTEYSPYYLHNNWGNYRGNGYFVEGSYDFVNGADLPSNTKSGEPGNYQFGVDIFPDLYY